MIFLLFLSYIYTSCVGNTEILSIGKDIAARRVGVNVKGLGAIGDGRHDDTFAIQTAIDSASVLQNGYVFFPNGTYSVSTLVIKSSLKGNKNTVLKNNSLILRHYNFCVVKQISDIRIDRITFDGSVKISEDGNVISGSIPLFIVGSKKIVIENCEFINSSMTGLKIDTSSDLSISKSVARNCRGDFGDGFYFSRTRNVVVKETMADYYNRIGFVTEDNSSNFVFEKCMARNGVNASILKGGTEFNAGFWYENSVNIKTLNCISENNTHRGFVATTGGKLTVGTGEENSVFEFKNCKSIKAFQGFVLITHKVSANFKLTNCKADSVFTGYILIAGTNKDNFFFENCSVIMNPLTTDNLNHFGFNWESKIKDTTDINEGLPKVTFQNCFVKYLDSNDLSKLLNRNSNSGDISTYGGGYIDISIINFTNSFKNQPAIIKARTGKPNYSISKTEYDPRFLIMEKKK